MSTGLVRKQKLLPNFVNFLKNNKKKRLYNGWKSIRGLDVLVLLCTAGERILLGGRGGGGGAHLLAEVSATKQKYSFFFDKKTRAFLVDFRRVKSAAEI